MNDSYYTEWPCFSSEASQIGYSHILDTRLDCSDPWEQMFSSFTHLTLASHTNLLYNTISSHFIGFGMIADIKPSGLLLFSYENMPLEYIFIGLLFISFHPSKAYSIIVFEIFATSQSNFFASYQFCSKYIHQVHSKLM